MMHLVKEKNHRSWVKISFRIRTFLIVFGIFAIFLKLLQHVLQDRGQILEVQSIDGSRYEKHILQSMDKLLDVYRQLDQAHKERKPPSFRILEDLKYAAAKLYPPIDVDVHVSFQNRYWSRYENQKPSESALDPHVLSDLLTILVFARSGETTVGNLQILNLIKDFHSSYPKINVFVIDSGLSHDDLAGASGIDSGQVTLVTVTTNSLSGACWNQAITQVKTPLVFIARDMVGFSEPVPGLEKLARVLRMPGVGAAGGTIQSGSKKAMGCYQSHLKNYVLSYREGHHFFQNESVFCDYIDGPFATYTHLMRNIQLDQHLQPNFIFQDFFLRVSKDWLLVVCADVMFQASGPMMEAGDVLLSGSWLGIARKWELNRIDIDSQAASVLLKYSCRDIGISCGSKIVSTYYYASPVCCQEDFAKALDFLARFCTANNIWYLLDCGTCLGAVKMADLMPWDRDGDGIYAESDYALFKNASSEYKRQGIQLGNFQDPACCKDGNASLLTNSYFQLFFSGMDVEMYAEPASASDSFLRDVSSVYADTKMEIHGVWVNGPPNPGWYARRRYGPECLRHAQSWVLTGKKSSFEAYDAGRFIRCRRKRHHSCLDGFPADGNIAFMVPE